jgi:hypothetical protein
VSRLMIQPLLVGLCLVLTIGAPLHAGVNGQGSTETPTSLPPNLPMQESGAATDNPAPKESPEQVRRRELVEQYGGEAADAILAGIVLKGMTKEQVLIARGAPERKEVIPADAELWHYRAGEVAFSGGRATYVELRSKVEPAPGGSQNAGPRQRAETPGHAASDTTAAIPQIAVGDSYVYESVDAEDPAATVVTKRTVTSTSSKIVLTTINLKNKAAKERRLYFNREWNLLASRNADNSGLDYSPPLKYFDFPLFPGKTWRQTTSETNIKTGAARMHTLSGTVGDWEEITVPAGTFRAIKVSLGTELVDPGTGETIKGTDISWYAPELRRSVKSITSGKDGKQRLIQLIRYELHP